MERKNGFRKVDAAISGRPDHAGKRHDEIIECARGRFAGAARTRTTRADRFAASSRQNDFVEGNRKSDSGKSSADRTDYFAGGGTSRGSVRSGTLSRLPNLQLHL